VNFVVIFAMAAGGSALILTAALVVRLLKYRTVENHEEHESKGFSLARYEPMARLLADEDFLFLRSQPGYRPEIGAKWRRERRRIFRSYLNDLTHDFHILHAEARAIVADSREEHSDLVGVLMRQQITMWKVMAGIELRLCLDRFGIREVDARRLVESIEAMRVELARFAAPAPVAPS